MWRRRKIVIISVVAVVVLLVVGVIGGVAYAQSGETPAKSSGSSSFLMSKYILSMISY